MRKNRLFAAVLGLCLAASLMLPATAYGHRRAAGCVQAPCPVCPVEDCTEPGGHSHDGGFYCGYDHVNGVCDGSCQTYTVRGGHHHGHGGCHG